MKTLVTRTKRPTGITINFPSEQRLYWTEFSRDSIRRSDLNGHGVETVIQLSHTARPQGIALIGDRIYWSTWASKEMESSRKDGSERRVHLTGDDRMNHVVAFPNTNLPSSGRINHCESQNCTKVCVPTVASFRCLV